MELSTYNHRHNFFHWLLTVSIRFSYSLIIIPLGIYIMAIGYFLSLDTIRVFLPENWIKNLNAYAPYLPYLILFKNSLFKELNDWYKNAPIWWTIVVGIPLILLGISLILISLVELYYTIFSRIHNYSQCPFGKTESKNGI